MAYNSKQSGSQPQKSTTSDRPRLARNRLFDSALRSVMGLNKQSSSVQAPVNERPPRYNKNPVPHQGPRNGAPRAQTGPRLASYPASNSSGRQTAIHNRSESNRDSVVHQKSANRPRSFGYDPKPQSTMLNVSKMEPKASSRNDSREEKNKVAKAVKSFFKKSDLKVTKPSTPTTTAPSVEQTPDTIEALTIALKAMPGFCGTISASGSSSASQEASPIPKGKEKEVKGKVANLDYR